MVLLYALMTGLTINVGEIIRREILSSAMKPQGRLLFPCLIMSLYLEAGGAYNQAEESLKNKGVINKTTISRIMGKNFEDLPSGAAATSSDHPTPETNTSVPDVHSRLDHLAAVQQNMLGMLQHMETQQNTYWHYVQQCDSAFHAAWEGTFSAPIPHYPQFPDSILKPWSSSDGGGVNNEEPDDNT